MTIRHQIIPIRLLIRRSVRYLLVKRGFRLVEAVVVLAALCFVLTGSRIAAIERLSDRADIVATVIVTALAIALLRAANRRVILAIDRRFFREAYDAQVILTELGEAVRTFSKIEQLLELVAVKITDALHPENVTIFLADEATGDLISAFSSGNPAAGAVGGTSPLTLVLPHDGWVIKRLSEVSPPDTIGIQGSGDFVDLPATGSAGGPLAREGQTLRTIRPALLIPIRSNGRLFGIISLGGRLGDLPYSKEDEQLLLVVASQMSTVIENASLIRRMAEEERIKRELDMAAEVQRHLFPAGALEDATLELYGVCRPARWVGGDYYDYFVAGERRVEIAIADVAGKGIAAALLMSTVQASLRCQLSSQDRSLTDVVSSMNHLLQRSTGDAGYATFFLAEFNKATRRLTYVNAGHNPPMLVRGGVVSHGEGSDLFKAPETTRYVSNKAVGTRAHLAASIVEKPAVRLLTTGGPIIGTFLNGAYEQETIHLESGDILAVYTDGVTEAMNPADVEFGEEKLRSLLAESLGLTAREVSERVIAKVLEWQGQASQHDDITLIIMKVK